MPSVSLASRFIIASLIINIVVAGACSIFMFADFTPFTRDFGVDNTARQILSCLYFAIAFMSLFALARALQQSAFSPASSPEAWGTLLWIAWGLFPLQIVYKLLTLIVVTDKAVPVIWFNLGIAIFHGISLTLAYKAANGDIKLKQPV